MDEETVSAEALAAGTAAAVAVEEIQSREALAAETETAAVEAAVAVDTASAAAESAAYAEAASEAALDAAEANTELTVQTAQIAYATAEELEALRADNEATRNAMREMREYIDTRLPLEPESPVVEEVEATDGISNSGGARSTETGSGEESGGEENGSSEKKQQRRGLKHRTGR
jgi:hypothetical protein